MKKLLILVCVMAMMMALLCGCSGNPCEHCGESTLSYNLVGDEVDGIQVCNTCIQKMTSGKLNFTFTCYSCEKEKLGKENEITVDGETQVVCNTCYGTSAEDAGAAE